MVYVQDICNKDLSNARFGLISNFLIYYANVPVHEIAWPPTRDMRGKTFFAYIPLRTVKIFLDIVLIDHLKRLRSPREKQ